jgi:hypothetical protein
MPDAIRDGTGKGNLAKVTDEGRLLGDVITQSYMAHASENYNAYSILLSHGQYNIDDYDYAMYIENTGATNLILSKAIIAANIAVGVSTIELFFDSTYTGGGNVSPNPINLNRGSLKTLNLRHIHASAVAGVLEGDIGTEFIHLCLSPYQNMMQIDFEDSVILPPNRSMGVQTRSLTAGLVKPDEFRLTLYIFEQ